MNPLWYKWLKNTPENIDFKIWASPDASKLMDERLEEYTCPWDQNDVLEHFKPNLIVSSACGEEQELLASQFAKQNNCKHIQFIDTFYGYKNRIDTSNDKDCYPNEIWLIHDIALGEAIDEGLESDRLKVTGHPYFEKLAKTTIKNQVPSGSVIFVDQPISQIEGLKDELGYDEKDIWKCLRDFKASNPDIIKSLIYAPHPAQKNVPSLHSDERLLKPSESPFEIAETMVGMFSTLMIEAYLKEQRVISVQCGLRTQNKDILSRAGFIPFIDEEQDFKEIYEGKSEAENRSFKKSFNGSLVNIERALIDT